MPSSPEFEEKKDDELRPLDPALRARAEAALGEDLGRVRLGRGPAAHAQAAELGARAFTIGADVYFAGMKTDSNGSPRGARRIPAPSPAHAG